MAIIYSDINAYNTSDKAWNYNLYAIEQSLRTILSVRPRTRWRRPTYFTNILKYLFEPMDDLTALLLFNEITIAVEIYEPRVKINYSRTNIIPNYSLKRYELDLAYDVRGLSDSNFKELHFLGIYKQGKQNGI